MTANETPKKGGILATLRRSPLVGADLNLTRSHEMKSVLKRNWIYWIIIPVAAVCAVIACGALFLESFTSDFGACKTIIRNSIPSPDGKKSLVIFGKECGATVDFNTQASITPAGTFFSLEKNPAFFAGSGEHSVTARWLGDNAVEIALAPGGGKVIKSEERVGDIDIVYR